MVSSQEDILTLVPKDRRLPPLRSFQRLIEELVAVHTQEAGWAGPMHNQVVI